MPDDERLQKLKTELDVLGKRVDDPASTHIEADDLLLEYIDDPDVTRLFNEIKKWYS